MATGVAVRNARVRLSIKTGGVTKSDGRPLGFTARATKAKTAEVVRMSGDGLRTYR